MVEIGFGLLIIPYCEEQAVNPSEGVKYFLLTVVLTPVDSCTYSSYVGLHQSQAIFQAFVHQVTIPKMLFPKPQALTVLSKSQTS